MAYSSQLKVDCSKRLGEAAQIRDWMGAGHILHAEPIYGLEDRGQPLVQAWHRVGFRHLPFELLVLYNIAEEILPYFYLGSPEWHLNLSRDRAGKLLIDFTPWDNLLHMVYRILDSEPAITFSYTPRELSKHPHPTDYREYSECMPRDLNELQDFCKHVVQHTLRWGDANIGSGTARGLFYSPVDEPDWQGYRDEPDEPQTVAKSNSILYYAACYRGIKEADPAAKVGGPRHGQWQHPVPDYGAAFSFREWLEEFKHYVDTNPDVGTDFLSWQDYHYFFEGPNLSDGAEAVRGYLKELGFVNAESVPFLLEGAGSGTWSADYTDNQKPRHKMAAYAARNIIREFKDGTAGRKFARASYMPFWQNIKAPSEHTCHSALVWVDDSTDPITLDFTATYAVFEMMKRMMQEDTPGAQIVQVETSDSLEAMATFSNNLAIILNNYSDQAQAVNIKINLPTDVSEMQGRLEWKACVQRIDAYHSNDGKGLEVEDQCWWPEPIAVESDPVNKNKTIQFSLQENEALAPFGTVLIRFYPLA